MSPAFSSRHLLFAASILVASAIVAACANNPALSSGPTHNVAARGLTGLSEGDSRLLFYVAANGQAPNGLRINFEGNGSFGSSEVEGAGVYQQFTVTGSPPFPITSAGTWEAKRLVSFNRVGDYGVLTSGILVMEVRLHQTIPNSQDIPATVTVICNIPAGGLSTGQPEGINVQVSGTTYVQQSGQTVFSTASLED